MGLGTEYEKGYRTGLPGYGGMIHWESIQIRALVFFCTAGDGGMWLDFISRSKNGEGGRGREVKG